MVDEFLEGFTFERFYFWKVFTANVTITLTKTIIHLATADLVKCKPYEILIRLKSTVATEYDNKTLTICFL